MTQCLARGECFQGALLSLTLIMLLLLDNSMDLGSQDIRASEMAQHGKVLVAKPDTLSSIASICVVEGRREPISTGCLPHICYDTHMHTQFTTHK